MKKAYVYAVVVDGTIRYIGKGSAYRMRAHMTIVRSIARRRASGETTNTTHFYNRLTKAWLDGADIQEVIIADGLTHEQAYEREIVEIAAWPGQLWNFWPGGEGSSKGYFKSDEQKQKIGTSNRQTWTDPTLLAEHSQRCKVAWLRPEYRELTIARMREAKSTPEFSARMRENALKRWADPEFRAKMYAIHHDPARKQQRSDKIRRGWNTRRAKQMEG